MHIWHRRAKWVLKPYVVTEEMPDDPPDRQVMADQMGKCLVEVIKELCPGLCNFLVIRRSDRESLVTTRDRFPQPSLTYVARPSW